MSERCSIFVSSVQKELEDERLIVQNLLNTDPFLSAHSGPLLYEYEPASPDKALVDCLKCLDRCQVYLLIVAVQYGARIGDISITHAGIPACQGEKATHSHLYQGRPDLKREEGTDALLREIRRRRPEDTALRQHHRTAGGCRSALVKLLQDRFGVNPSSDEDKIALQTIEATSFFESQPLTRPAGRTLIAMSCASC